MGISLTVSRGHLCILATQHQQAFDALRSQGMVRAGASSLLEVFEEKGYEVVYNICEDIVGLIDFPENYHDDELFFAVLAPFMSEGDSLDVEIGYGDYYRWEVRDGKLYEIEGEVTFGGPAREISPPNPAPDRQG